MERLNHNLENESEDFGLDSHRKLIDFENDNNSTNNLRDF